MIKLLATDLDGTLFYPKRKIRVISTKNKKFLTEFAKKGGKVVLVSGRNYHIVPKISKIIDSTVDMIACNGSLIIKDKKVFSETPVDKEMAKQLYEDNKNDDKVVTWVIMTNKYPTIIIPTKMGTLKKQVLRIGLYLQFAYQDKFVIGEKHFYKMLADDESKIYKVMAIYGLGKEAVMQAKNETKRYVDAYGTNFEVLWSSQSIEFMKKGVNKANALKTLLSVLKLDESEVAVVGDSGNDVPLFEEFSNSFVMKNAPSEVKKKAKTEVEGVYCIKEYID